MHISITDNPKEQAEQGRKFFAEKSSIYHPGMVAAIQKTIRENMPDASDAEREEMFYRSIYDYWTYGNNIDEEFYYFFYKKSHAEKSAYLTCRNRLLYFYHLNDKKDAHYLNNKYEAYLEFKDYYKRDVLLVTLDTDYATFSDFADKHSEFVVKPLSLGLATGVHKVSVPDPSQKQAVFDALLDEIKEYRTRYSVGYADRLGDEPTAILEEIIDQDESLAKIHPASVNGIRCTTVNVDGKVHLLHPWFKIGANGGFITSAAIGTFDAGIDAKTGVVDTFGFNEKGEGFEYHPTTGVKIPGYVIPKWDELLELLQVIGTHFPTIRYIGWDMVLTKKGWCIMEGNFGGEAMWQLMYGKGMKAEFEELIGWKPEHEFWWQNKC